MLYPSVNSQKTWLGFLLLILVLLNLYFHFSFDGTVEERGRWIDKSLSTVVRPFQTLVSGAGDWIESGGSKVTRLWEADRQNQELLKRIEIQETDLLKLSEVERENARLRELLEFRPSVKAKLQGAKVVGREVNSFFRSIEIDRGADDGLERGFAVVSNQGVVGRILRISDSHSTVLLITDLNSRVEGVVERSRTQVVVGGAASGDLRLHFLPRRADVLQEDWVVTSGLGGVFPPGFRVGRITSKTTDPDFVLEDADLEPAVDFGKLEEVFVVMGFDPKRGS